eukprot:14460-Hanusia_phi.AAC.2
MSISLLAKLFQIPFVDTFLFWSYPFIVMFYAYGYAPMVPTCFMSDILSFFDWLLPEVILYPNALQTSNNGINNVNITNKDTCEKSCQSYGLEYKNIDANIAWYMCSFSIQQCRQFSDWYYSQGLVPKFSGLKRLIAQKALILETGSSDDIFAQDLLCCWTAIPVIGWLHPIIA